MKKIMILAVVAALLGISAPNTMAQVPGSSQPSSTQQDDERDQQSTSPNPSTTQPGTSGTTETQPGTSGSQPGTTETEQGTSGSSGNVGTSGSSTTTSMEYKEEVKVADLPAAVTRSINEKYPGYKTEKAFRGQDGTYKVKLSKGDETQTLFFDERGESVKMKK